MCISVIQLSQKKMSPNLKMVCLQRKGIWKDYFVCCHNNSPEIIRGVNFHGNGEKGQVKEKKKERETGKQIVERKEEQKKEGLGTWKKEKREQNESKKEERQKKERKKERRSR